MTVPDVPYRRVPRLVPPAKTRKDWRADISFLMDGVDDLLDEFAAHTAREPKSVDVVVAADLLYQVAWKLRVARRSISS